MENKKDVETPLNEMWKHVDTHELQKWLDAYPIPDATDYLQDHTREIAAKILEPTIQGLALQILTDIMKKYSSNKLNEKPWDFTSRLDAPIIQVNVKMPKDLPQWVGEMAHIETVILPRKYLPFKSETEEVR